MTAATARKAPARRSRPEPLLRWREFRQAAGLSAVVLAAAVLSRPGAAPKPQPAPAFATVQIPEADRARIDSWPKFFACYDLTSPQGLMTATLRAADYAHRPQWRADAAIQVPLAPPVMTPTPAEAAVLLQAVRLAQQRAVPGADPCGGAGSGQAAEKSSRHSGNGEAGIRDLNEDAGSLGRSRPGARPRAGLWPGPERLLRRLRRENG